MINNYFIGHHHYFYFYFILLLLFDFYIPFFILFCWWWLFLFVRQCGSSSSVSKGTLLGGFSNQLVRGEAGHMIPEQLVLYLIHQEAPGAEFFCDGLSKRKRSG